MLLLPFGPRLSVVGFTAAFILPWGVTVLLCLWRPWLLWLARRALLLWRPGLPGCCIAFALWFRWLRLPRWPALLLARYGFFIAGRFSGFLLWPGCLGLPWRLRCLLFRLLRAARLSLHAGCLLCIGLLRAFRLLCRCRGVACCVRCFRCTLLRVVAALVILCLRLRFTTFGIRVLPVTALLWSFIGCRLLAFSLLLRALVIVVLLS